jgi:hypothetical protein
MVYLRKYSCSATWLPPRVQTFHVMLLRRFVGPSVYLPLSAHLGPGMLFSPRLQCSLALPVLFWPTRTILFSIVIPRYSYDIGVRPSLHLCIMSWLPSSRPGDLCPPIPS